MASGWRWHHALTGRTVVTMADIWLTSAAETEFNQLQADAPDKAASVSDAINDITVKAGERIDLAGAPPEAPFLAKEPDDPDAPAVIYRSTTTGEPGKWLVVSLIPRDDYRAARRAERELATYPPAVQDFVHRINTLVAGTVATATVIGRSGTPTVTPHGASTSATREGR